MVYVASEIQQQGKSVGFLKFCFQEYRWRNLTTPSRATFFQVDDLRVLGIPNFFYVTLI